MLPVLTEFEKERLSRSDSRCRSDTSPFPMRRWIDAHRGREGERSADRLIILGHHYQRDEVIRVRRLHRRLVQARPVMSASIRSAADFIVFCGVHFMAESADVLSGPATSR